MAQTKVIIIYSANQNRRRTVIKPHDDSHVYHHALNIAPGERVLIGTLADYDSIGPDVMLEKHTGQKASSDRCVVVDADGNVTHGLKADPLIDNHPSGVIHQHDEAHPGWKHVNDQWITPPEPIVKPISRDDLEQYPITITDGNISIGCETHTAEEWDNFKDSRIALMDDIALAWWRKNKAEVMRLAGAK